MSLNIIISTLNFYRIRIVILKVLLYVFDYLKRYVSSLLPIYNHMTLEQKRKYNRERQQLWRDRHPGLNLKRVTECHKRHPRKYKLYHRKKSHDYYWSHREAEIKRVQEYQRRKKYEQLHTS